MVKLVTKVERVLPGVKFVGGKASIGNVNLAWGRDGKSIILYSTTVRHAQGRLDISMSADAIKGTMRRVHEASEIFDKIVNDKRMKGVELIDTLYITRNYVNAAVKVGDEFKKFFYRDISIGGKFSLDATDKVYSGKNKPYKLVTKKKELRTTRKKEFDMVRFHKYIDLVIDFRTTYADLVKLKTTKINTSAIDLDNPLQVLTALVHRARLYNKLTYKSTNEEEAQRIINKVNKIKEERKESAKAGSSLPSEFQVEEYKGERKWKQ